MKQNFIETDTQDKIDNHVNNGDLKPSYLIDPDFGGSTNEDNIIYVTNDALILKEKINDILRQHIVNGNKVKLYIDLKYIGNSKVPSKLIINYTLNEIDKYTEEIIVWGNNSCSNSRNFKLGLNKTINNKIIPSIIIKKILGVLFIILGLYLLINMLLENVNFDYKTIIFSLLWLFIGIIVLNKPNR